MAPSDRAHPPELELGPLEERVSRRLERWDRDDLGARLWDGDPTVWFAQPMPELTDRLGWLTLPDDMAHAPEELHRFAADVSAGGVRHIVLLGMGGSSLAPEVFAATLETTPGAPRLLMLDTTHPTAVRAAIERVDPSRALFVVSSKSGTTIETLSLFRACWSMVARAAAQPGRQFVAITDPGTPLETLANERGFLRVYQAPFDVGGRYSALSVFGLVPAALAGANTRRVIERAQEMARASGPDVPAVANPALRLGAALGELFLAGRDKLTFCASPGLATVPAWIEQLVAESTGKDGKGLVPIVDEPRFPSEHYGDDRAFVFLTLARDGEPDPTFRESLARAGHPVINLRFADPADLGREMFRWELATAVTGAVLGIHPFDQPDVQVAKDLARKAMQGDGGPGADDEALRVAAPDAVAAAVGSWARAARPRDYVALQAYLAPNNETSEALQRLRRILGDRLRIATTVGYGPRFLHSTGQLHKGGPDTGLFLQLVDEPSMDLPIPETDATFGRLIGAQALGDFAALRQRGRRALRVTLGEDTAAGLAQLADILDGTVTG